MILHAVRLDFGAVEEPERSRLESRLRELASLPQGQNLQILRDIEKPHFTVLVCWFADREAMVAYHASPLHAEVGAEVVAAGLAATSARFDVEYQAL